MRVDCGQLDPGAVIRPVPGEWHPRMPERLDEEELAAMAMIDGPLRRIFWRMADALAYGLHWGGCASSTLWRVLSRRPRPIGSGIGTALKGCARINTTPLYGRP
jgi:hypothetical protein